MVGGCRHSNVDGSVHLFPKDPTVRRKWESFVKSTRLHWGPATAASIICGSHFRDTDFQNLSQFRMGLASRLMLKHNAVPSIKFPGPSATTTTSTSAADGSWTERSMTVRKACTSEDPSPWKAGTAFPFVLKKKASKTKPGQVKWWFLSVKFPFYTNYCHIISPTDWHNQCCIA